MINLINNLLDNDRISLDNYQNIEEYKEFLYLHATHLHINNHNIFSRNVPSGLQNFGMFLSVDSALRILNINDNGWFSDEIFTLFHIF